MKIEIEAKDSLSENDKIILRENLMRIPVPDLTKILGKDIAKNLANAGEDITSPNLAEKIIDVHAEGIFNNKTARDYFSEFNETEKITTWSANKKCNNFLSEVGLSKVFLPEKKQKREFTEKIDASFKLHDYQDFIKRKTSNFLLSDDQSKLMIQLPTGAGKTALAMHSIYDFLRVSEEENPLIVWMAHTDELCEQAIESFKMGWPGAGTKEITLMRLWGNTLKDLDQLPNTPVFAVASFQTANNMISSVRGEIFDLFLKIRDNSSLLIVDEAHMALAPTYNDAIEFFAGQNCKIIGLTATPGRHGIDGNTEETEELAEYFNGNIFDLNKFCGGKSPIEYLQDRGILSKVERLVLQTDFKINFTSSEIKKLESTGILSEKKLKESGSDEKRTNLIIDQIQKLVEKKKKILVFSPSKDSSNIYATLLKAKNIRAESVTGETSFNARKRAVTNFSEGKIDVLINYGVFTTGFDDPKINCIVVARPTYSVVLYSQMIGRGLRGPKNNGTEDCLIVDVLDNILNQPDIEIACNFFANEWI